MRVLTSFKQVAAVCTSGVACTVGNYDGVHCAHQVIISLLKNKARKKKIPSLVISFVREEGRSARKQGKPLLTSVEHKLFLLDQMGVDYCYLFRFNKRLTSVSAEKFVTDILVKKFNVKAFVIGYNFKFGKNRSGDVTLLKRLAEKYDIDFNVVGPVEKLHAPVSSSRIRSIVEQGNLKHARTLLCRPYSIFGDVIRGAGRGRGLGFPTANLNPHSEVLPPNGVYIVNVNIWCLRHIKSQRGEVFKKECIKRNLKGVVNLGFAPTFYAKKKIRPQAEVHILNFKKSLRSFVLEVTFCRKLREERCFTTQQSLIDQIDRDITRARNYFS